MGRNYVIRIFTVREDYMKLKDFLRNIKFEVDRDTVIEAWTADVHRCAILALKTHIMAAKSRHSGDPSAYS